MSKVFFKTNKMRFHVFNYVASVNYKMQIINTEPWRSV